jgi:CRISPR/Cas system-associated endonuclease/helicase Cas3
MLTDVQPIFIIKGVGEDIYRSSTTNNRAASVFQDAAITGSASMDSSDSTATELISNQVALLTIKRNLLQENYLLESMMSERDSGLQQPIDSLCDHAAVKPATYLALKRFLKSPSAGFKTTTQALCVQRVLRRNSNLLCIMPTGGGKSLLFMLPAYMEEKITIVVVPFVALLEDLRRRLGALDMAYAVWENNAG